MTSNYNIYKNMQYPTSTWCLMREINLTTKTETSSVCLPLPPATCSFGLFSSPVGIWQHIVCVCVCVCVCMRVCSCTYISLRWDRVSAGMVKTFGGVRVEWIYFHEGRILILGVGGWTVKNGVCIPDSRLEVLNPNTSTVTLFGNRVVQMSCWNRVGP